MKIIRTIILVLILSTMITIFGFSGQDGAKSKGISTKICEYILKFNNTYQEANQKEKIKILNRTNAVIRKIAHFSIYTILGVLLTGLMIKTKIQDRWRFIITIFIGLIYAISDEIHQSFSPGRTPLVTDVYIDVLGVIIGALIVILFKKIYHKYYKNVTKRRKMSHKISCK